MGSYVYLLHFNPKFHHCSHYLGFTTKTVSARVATHLKGRGSRLVKFAVKSGCTVTIAKVWNYETSKEARANERKMKQTHNIGRYCPECGHRNWSPKV